MRERKEKIKSCAAVKLTAAVIFTIVLAFKRVVSNTAAAVICIILIMLTMLMKAVHRFSRKGDIYNEQFQC